MGIVIYAYLHRKPEFEYINTIIYLNINDNIYQLERSRQKD